MRPDQIEGWMGREPLRWLARTARRHARIIEIGSWKGRSTKALAHPDAVVWAVDTWQGVPDDPTQHKLYVDTESAWGDFREHLAPEIDRGHVVPMRMDRLKALRILADQYGPTFGMIFIDADHRYEAVHADITAALPMLRPGGILCGHDYHWPGPRKAVDELLPDATRGPASLWSYTPCPTPA